MSPLPGAATQIAFRDVLVVVQVAICFVLVSACLLSLRGLQRTLTVHWALILTESRWRALILDWPVIRTERGRDFQRRALMALENLPGVQSAAFSNSVPVEH